MQTSITPNKARQSRASVFAWLGDFLGDRSLLASSGPLGAAVYGLRRTFRYIVGFSAVISFLYLSSSIYMMLVYDKVLSSGSHVTLIAITLALVAALATLAYLDTMRRAVLAKAGLRLDRQLSDATITHILGRAARGDLSPSELLRDFDRFRSVMTGSPVLALFDAPWAIIFLVVLFLLHWSLAALAVAGGVLFLIIARLTELHLRAPIANASAASASSNAALSDTLSHAGPLQAMGMTDAVIGKMRSARERSRSLTSSTAMTNATSSGVLKFLRLLWQGLALGLGAWLAIDGKIQPGAMIAGSILLGRVLAPLEQIVGNWRALVEAGDAYSRLKAALGQPAETHLDKVALPKLSGAVEVKNLTVETEEGSRLLDSVSFSIAPGESLGVIGPTGAGKSTLIRALLGMQQVTDGAVRFDGAELSQWRPEDFSRHIGYLPQEVSLIAGTVIENIARFEMHGNSPGADIDERAVEAAILVGMHEEILKLPDGYNTRIERGGVRLSGGQRQRIGLARAVYRSPSLIVLDEPGAHLDHIGEAALMSAIQRVRENGATVIFVTHRASMLSAATTILSLVGGQVQLCGPRDEILKTLASRTIRPVSGVPSQKGVGS